MPNNNIITPKRDYKGLSSAEAEMLLKQYGFNAPPTQKKGGWVLRLLKVFSEPMMLLILCTAVVYFFIGEKLESLIFLLSIIPIGLMEFAQEQRTDQALSMLDKLMVSHCQVFRDGSVITVETKFIVPGDLAYLTAGDKIPADGFLLNSPGLLVDESALTGESVSVAKSESSENMSVIQEENKLWQGTLVTQGEGYLLIEKTGINTAYGHLGSLLEKIKKGKTPLQQKLNKLLKIIAIFAVIIAITVGLLLALKHGWVEGILSALTMAMSLIPEEFPVVFSVFLVLGVLRMGKRNALVREMTLVEILGSATVICTDKTGTLTEGRMSLKKIYANGAIIPLEENANVDPQARIFMQDALLALERVAIDPIETEAHRFASAIGLEPHKHFEAHRLIEDVPFNAKTKLVHHLWQDKNDGFCQYSAGAPEYIMSISVMSEIEKEKAARIFEDMSKDGYRVIGIAKKIRYANEKIIESELNFVGFLIMSDPPRVEVKESIALCQRAGIRVIMITGDNKFTAGSVAESIGLNHSEEIISGEDIDKYSPDALKEKIKRCNIFVRVKPEQKYLIVKILQELGEVVAMTGDGVNDAPALKKANIGVAMGKRGTDVARAAAGMILLDDDFSTIVKAVKEGRRIYENMRHAFVFLLSFHIPIVGLALLPLFFNQPLIFVPIHIIFLELVCDPASVLGFEKELARRNIMKEPPRKTSEPLINTKLWKQVLWQGLGILFVSFSFYYFFGLRAQNTDLGRTAAFIALISSQVFILYFTREWAQLVANKTLILISVLTMLVLSLFLFTPPLRELFYFSSISLKMFAFILAVCAASSFAIGVIVKGLRDK